MTRAAGPDRPSVSAILISDRSDGVLATASESLVRQDYRPLELVIFGNGRPIEPPPVPDDADVTVRSGSSDENLGVAAGRNAASLLAGGELLLFLDDDAVLRPGGLEKAVAVVQSSPDVGAVAFRVTDPEAGTPALWYYAHDAEAWRHRPFEASSVVGCGNLVRRECFERLGGFWDGYFREVEEIDLSWRLLDHGWAIRYEPEVEVMHPERTLRHLRFSVASNLLLAWRLLPFPLALRQTAVKLPLFAFRAVRHGEVRELLSGLRDAVAAIPRVLRSRPVLRPRTVRYLRHVHAPQGLGKRLQWSLRPLPPPPASGGQPIEPGRRADGFAAER